jgi:SAM-dependent methyltransferase
MEKINCNFCGSLTYDLLGTFRDLSFEKSGEFPYVRCRTCGLIYLHERPTQQEIQQYYPPEYLPYRKAIQDERYPWMRKARRRNINTYCRIVQESTNLKNGRVLDIGCATGIFLDAMRDQSWEPKGVEISEPAVRYARQRFNLDVFHGQLNDLQVEPGYFDAITMWNVIEHLYQPLETFVETFRLLKPEGVLLLVFPSWESTDRRLFGTCWVGFDAPRHLYVFPRSVMIKMLAAAGYGVVQLMPAPNNYFAFIASLERWLRIHAKPPFLRGGIMKLVNLPGMRYLFQPFIALADRSGNGSTTLVIARKNQDVLSRKE